MHQPGVSHRIGLSTFLSVVLALFFIARRIQSPLSLVDRESRILCTHELIVLHCLLGLFSFVFVLRGKIPVRATAPRFKLTSQRQKVSRLPTEPPGRPVVQHTYSSLYFLIKAFHLLFPFRNHTINRVKSSLYLFFSIRNPSTAKSTGFSDLPICSPWTFRENHSPNIIYTVNRRNQPTVMDLYFLDWVRTRYKTEPETHTKSAHTVL